MLRVKNLYTKYGPVSVLKNISLHVDQGDIVCLIGANGAGKTTLLLAVSGLVRPERGEILLNGTRLDGLSADKIVALGVGHSPEGRQVFAPLTVMENLRLGAFQRGRESAVEVGRDLDEVFQLFPRLGERRCQLAGTLSGGEQQMLAMGRAMMARPSLLLLDEPSLGLAPKLVDVIMKTIVTLNGRGMTVLLVEQNASKALEIAHRGYVLETGRIILQGSAQELARDSEVRRAYLGRDYDDLSDRSSPCRRVR